MHRLYKKNRLIYHITNIYILSTRSKENYLDFEATVQEQFDSAVLCLERRRSYLMDTIKLERDRKQRTFKEQV